MAHRNFEFNHLRILYIPAGMLQKKKSAYKMQTINIMSVSSAEVVALFTIGREP